MKKRTAFGILLALILLLAAVGGNAEKTVSITFTGDCTLGSEESERKNDTSFDAYAAREGYGYFFSNFRELFAGDDATVINLECVLSDSMAGESQTKRYRFRGPRDFVNIINGNSIEICGLANNHTADYAAQGFNSTKSVLEENGIRWAYGMDGIPVVEKDGIRIAIISLDKKTHLALFEKKLRPRIQEAKATGEWNAVVVIFHDGTEYDAKHNYLQDKVGQLYADCGTDLVIMHHSHVVQGVHVRNNCTIFYCLGNFCFGGNKVTRWEPYKDRMVTALYTLVVRANFYFYDDGTYKGQQMVIYPGFTSSQEKVENLPQVNDYHPRRVTVEEAEPIREAVQFDTTVFELPKVTADESGYARIVLDYVPSGNEEPYTAAATVQPGEAPEPASAKPARTLK